MSPGAMSKAGLAVRPRVQMPFVDSWNACEVCRLRVALCAARPALRFVSLPAPLECASAAGRDLLLDKVLPFLERRPLSLESLIAVSPDQHCAVDMQNILQQRSICQSRLPECWLDADLSHVWTSPDMTHDLRLRFQDIVTVWQDPDVGQPLGIHLFTDGSFRSGEGQLTYGCAWSFCAWLVGDKASRLIGHASHCAVPQDTPYYLGEDGADSLCGEMLALAWAYVWALDYGLSYELPFTLAFDCTPEGLDSLGFQRPPGTDAFAMVPPLAAFTVSLRLCLSALAEVIPRHTKSHSGILGNELVDQLAKAASRSAEDFYTRCLPTWPARLASHKLHAWAWRVLETNSDLPTLFALPSESGRLQLTRPAPVPPPTDGQPPMLLEGSLHVCLHLVTANVLSLLDPAPSKHSASAPHAAGMRLYGKRDVLKRQLEEVQAHVVGLQETRLQGDADAPDADFFMLQASATCEGQYGVALWLSRARPFLWFNGKPVRIEREQLTVVVAEPRLLIVDVSTPVFRFAGACASRSQAE